MMGLVLAGVAVSGYDCKKSVDEVSGSKSVSIALCVKCGQIKGSELCCKPIKLINHTFLYRSALRSN